jgi:hypothetical protein
VALGNTWDVNAVMIGSILLLILFANFIVSLLPRLWLPPVYVLLIGSCVGLYFVDLSQFAGLPYPTRAAVVGGLSSLPMLFSGIVFMRSFAQAEGKDVALGANLLGSLVAALQIVPELERSGDLRLGQGRRVGHRPAKAPEDRDRPNLEAIVTRFGS